MMTLGQLEIVGAVVAAVFYFVPAVIAYVRGHQSTLAIFVLNLLLGWTFIGWVVALVWSLTAVDRPRKEHGRAGG